MKDRCIQAVSDAIGRSITQAEAKGIEDRILKSMRFAAMNDPEAFRKMSADERLKKGASLAAKELVAEAELKKRRILLTIQAHDRLENFIGDMKAKGMACSRKWLKAQPVSRASTTATTVNTRLDNISGSQSKTPVVAIPSFPSDIQTGMKTSMQ